MQRESRVATQDTCGLCLGGLLLAIELPLAKRPSKCHIADFRTCLAYFCHHPLFLADSTGTHSLYTTYKDYEVMFHVSTMLPHMPNNRQQVGPPSSFRISGQPTEGLHVVRICKESLAGAGGGFLNGVNNITLTLLSLGSIWPLNRSISA